MPEDFSKIIEWNLKHEGRGDEMKKKVGNALWNYLHTLAEWTAPNEEKQRTAFNALKSNIEAFPCKDCSTHGMRYILDHPFDNNFKEYIWKFHNAVNEKLNKPQYPLPKEYATIENCVPKYIVEEFASTTKDEKISQMINKMATCEA